MLVGGVVGHEVDDHPQVELVRAGDQRVGVGEVAEERVDVAVVGDVVAVVVLRRGVERRDPERVHAEVAEVGQPRRDAGEVADAVAVRVGEGTDVDLVDDGVAPPALIGAHVSHPRGQARLRRMQSGRPRSRCARRSRRSASRRRRAWPT